MPVRSSFLVVACLAAAPLEQVQARWAVCESTWLSVATQSELLVLGWGQAGRAPGQAPRPPRVWPASHRSPTGGRLGPVSLAAQSCGPQ